MIEFLLLDLDDTILDFYKAERLAIAKTFSDFGVEPTETVLHRYHLINRTCWERLETGEWTREQVLVNRFSLLFDEVGVEADATACARAYEKNLSIGHYFLPGALEAVQTLSAPVPKVPLRWLSASVYLREYCSILLLCAKRVF